MQCNPCAMVRGKGASRANDSPKSRATDIDAGAMGACLLTKRAVRKELQEAKHVARGCSEVVLVNDLRYYASTELHTSANIPW